MTKDADYYSRRAAAELELARAATVPAVTAAHYRLAELYLERAQASRHAAPPESASRAA